MKKASFGGLLAIVVLLSSSCGSPDGNGIRLSAAQTGTSGSAVADIQLINSASGWALSDDALSWTDDNGASWRDITPLTITAQQIASVFFLDTQDGWLLAPATSDAAQRQELSVFVTKDGGRTWAPNVASPIDAAADASPIEIEFVDQTHGWIMLTQVTSSNFSVGDLYRTVDGGTTWTRATIPIAGPIEFTSPTDGWTAGGATGDELYFTRDGGDSWTRTDVPKPPAFKTAAVVYGSPKFFTPQDGVLPVTFTGNSVNAGFAFYETDDGGVTWTPPGPVVPRHQALDGGVSMLADAATRSTWFEADPAGGSVVIARNRGKNQSQIAATGLPPGLVRLDFGSEAVGWAVSSQTECHDKINCSYTSELVQTRNAGQGWNRIAVP